MTERERTAAAQRERAIVRLCEGLGLDRSLPRLDQALTHPSFANEQPRAERVDNQRLEFLGDAVLGLCVSELLMDRFGLVDEGQLTVMRAALVNTEALAGFARQVGMADALLVGRGADATGERHRTNVLADALEAVVGAVYLDCGLEGARQLSAIIAADRLNALIAEGGIERDAKSRLQERLQARGLAPPQYCVVSSEGPPHARSFRVQVEIDCGGEGVQVAGVGEGRSKKLAEQAAARAALAHLGAEAADADDE